MATGFVLVAPDAKLVAREKEEEEEEDMEGSEDVEDSAEGLGHPEDGVDFVEVEDLDVDEDEVADVALERVLAGEVADMAAALVDEVGFSEVITDVGAAAVVD